MPRGKIRVVSQKDREDLAAKRAENDRLFRVYMIEIGQWKVIDGQITWTGTYKSEEEILSGFKAWLKGAKNTNK